MRLALLFINREMNLDLTRHEGSVGRILASLQPAVGRVGAENRKR
jgi:hypothetical protein